MKSKKEKLNEFLEILFNCAEEVATEVEPNNKVDKPETENESK